MVSYVVIHAMEERSAKRARQDGEAAGVGGKIKLAGCHLEVRASTSYIFVGNTVDVEVRLLNDEDVVQHTTVGINVSLTGEDKVRLSSWSFLCDDF